MTFSAPVESLNATSTLLREAEPQAPKQLKELLIRAADELDDLQRRLHDTEAVLRLVRGLMGRWAGKLDAASSVRIGQMDSASRAAEKTESAQRVVTEVAVEMRDVALRS